MTKLIPKDFIYQLLNHVDIVQVIEHYIPLKKMGAAYKALCPFHQEKSPSFQVNAQKQFFHCFGCGASGDAIKFIMDFEHLSFVEAVETLAHQYGLEVPRDQATAPSQSEDIYTILKQCALFYQEQLKKNSATQAYLESRGVNAAMIERYQLGFAPDSWDQVLKKLGSSEAQQAALLKAGMLVAKEQGGYYDRFRHRVMFPIHDPRGRVIAFGGRVMDQSLPKYLNSPETPIFHKSQELYGLYQAKQAGSLKTILVTEGYMDVIALAQQGISYAVATLGTAITAQHLQKLMRLSSEIIFCFDGDAAGLKAAHKALDLVTPMIRDSVEARFMFLPAGEDPDSLIRSQGKTAFLTLQAEAVSLSDFLFNSWSEDLNLEIPEGRAKLVTLALPVLSKMTAPHLQAQFYQKLAELARIPLDQLKTWQEAPSPERAVAKQEPTSKTKPTGVRSAIALLLQHPSLVQHLPESLPYEGLAGVEILSQMAGFLRLYPHATTPMVVEHFREHAAYEVLSKLVYLEVMSPKADHHEVFRETLRRVEREHLDQRIQPLLEKAQRGELSVSEKQALQALLKLKKI